MSEDVVGANLVTRRAYITEQMVDFGGWSHLRTVLRIESETRTRDGGERVAHENRYFLCSLPRVSLADTQWLRVVRLHWGVENNCHNTFDKILPCARMTSHRSRTAPRAPSPSCCSGASPTTSSRSSGASPCRIRRTPRHALGRPASRLRARARRDRRSSNRRLAPEDTLRRTRLGRAPRPPSSRLADIADSRGPTSPSRASASERGGSTSAGAAALDTAPDPPTDGTADLCKIWTDQTSSRHPKALTLSSPRVSSRRLCAPIAQLDRALVYGTRCRKFESSWAR